MRVLIVDDEEIALELLENALTEAGYEVEVAHNGVEALNILRSGKYQLVISDWEMPEMNGIELCRAIRKRHFSSYIYFVLVTSRESTDDVVNGLNAGADDFITKPFQPSELCMRLRVGERLLSLESRDMIIFAMAKLAESRDSDTGAHLERIREYSKVLAQHLTTLPEFSDTIDGEYVQTIFLTSPLHDIGKVAIPDHVLLKPGKLTNEEFEIMKTHTTTGAETLAASLRAYPDAEFLRVAHEIALTHHEHYDGKGYPKGLTGRQIPLSGRIVALADVYDALTTKRVYKDAFPHDVARSIVLEGKGTHFDPAIVDCFIAKEKEFVSIRKRFSDPDFSILDQIEESKLEPASGV